MANNLTQYAQKKLLDHTMGRAAYTMPSVHAGLFTSSPGETGSLAGEVIGGSYARVALTAKMGATTLGTGVALNTVAVTFPSPSASWGVVTHFGVMDAASAGNVLLYMPLNFSFLVASGSAAPSFGIGAITIVGGFQGTDRDQMTQYLVKKWIDHLLGTAAFTMPTAVYLGLFSSDPTYAGILTGEVAVGGYARQNLTSVISMTDLATGIAENGDAITFPVPTASYSVTYFGVLDALTSGNMLFRQARTSTLNVRTGGARVTVQDGGLQLQAD
jgi:hypothetical protein